MIKLLAIDPSTSTVGYAVFHDDSLVAEETKHFNDPEMNFRLPDLYQETFKILLRYEPEIVLIEKPQSWTRGGRNIESLQKLALASGIIAGAAIGFGRPPKWVPVSEWKGTRRSKMIRKEAELLFQCSFSSDHASDAAAMGWWWLNRNLRKLSASDSRRTRDYGKIIGQ